MIHLKRRIAALSALAPLLFFAQCGLKGGSGASDAVLATYEGPPGTGSLALFTISSTGLLTISGSAQSAGNRVSGAKINSNGTFAYAVNYADNTISQFSVSGKLFSPLTPATVTTTGNPYDIVLHPTANYAYVSNNATNLISQFSIDLNGALTPLNPPTVTTGAAGGSNPTGLAITPAGTFLYAALNGGAPGNIAQFTIGTDGKLTPTIPASSVAGTGAKRVAVDPTSKYAYSANTSAGNISQYSIGLDGKLVVLNPQFVSAGGGGTSWVAITPNGQFLYAANPIGNSIGQFAIAPATGKITALTPAVVTAGTSPTAIAITSDSQYAYAANATSNDISQFSIGSDGTLTPLSPPTVISPDSGLGITLQVVKAK